MRCSSNVRLTIACAQAFEEEQGLVARLIHRLKSSNPGQHFALLQAARNRFSAGGPRRLKHTLPPIAFSALNVVRRLCAQAGPKEAVETAAPSPKEVRSSITSLPDICS